MPLYSYRCNACKYEEEKFKRVEDRQQIYTCPKCAEANKNLNPLVCDIGIMEFQPIQKTTFRMSAFEREA